MQLLSMTKKALRFSLRKLHAWMQKKFPSDLSLCWLPIVNTAQTLEVFILSQVIKDGYIIVFAVRSVFFKSCYALGTWIT